MRIQTSHPLSRSIARSFLRWLGVLCLMTVTAATACSKRDSADPASPDEPARSIITTVTTTLAVDDVSSSTDALRKLVDKHGGHVANASIVGADDPVASFEARIPSDKLGAFREELRGLGKVDHESENVEDVTAPHADLEARLRNAQSHEKRLLQLLEEKTGSLADVVAIEKEIAAVRENIERLEAEKRVMDRRIAYASVQVRLEPAHTALWSHPGDAVASAFDMGLRGARNLVVGIIVVGAAALPSVFVLGLGALVLFLLARSVWRWRSRRSTVTS